MSTPRAPTDDARAARAAARAPDAGRRRHPADDLDVAIMDLEALARRVRGCSSHAAIHDNEDEAQRIAREILTVFRGPTARPSAVPLYVSADGRKAAW